MADEKKSVPAKAETKASEKPATPKPAAEKADAGKNGKGDAPRNCFSDSYRSNFDGIDWSK